MLYLFRLGKTIIALLLGIILVGVIAGLIYLNQIGFPGHYSERLCEELAKRGVHLKFESLQFSLKQGLIAQEVQFFKMPDDERPTLTAKKVILGIDQSLALRGELKLREALITDASTHFIAAENLEVIQAHDIHSKIYFGPGNLLRIRKTSGRIQGINIDLTADLIQPVDEGSDEDEGPSHLESVLRPLLDELARWEFSEERPPEIQATIRGDLSKPEEFHTNFSLLAENLSRHDYHLDKLQLSGDLRSRLITVDRIFLKDRSGQAEGQADWSLENQEGRFQLSSSLQFQHFLQTCFDLEIAPRLKINSSPEILLEGTIEQKEDQRISVRMTGEARAGPFHFINTNYEKFSSAFSWQDGSLFLQDLKVIHKKGQIEGDFIAQGSDIRYHFRSSLPLEAFRPFLPEKGHDAKTIADFNFTANSITNVNARGTLNRDNLKEWQAVGDIYFTNFSYRDLKAFYTLGDFNISPDKIEFRKVKVHIDDREEAVCLRFQSAASSELNVDAILYEPPIRKLVISNLRGTAWPSPIVRAFTKHDPNIANSIEDDYRFHEPPELTLNGSFDCRGKGNIDYNSYMVSVRTTGQTDYTFLKRNLALTELSANLFYRQRELNIAALSFAGLGGQAHGDINVSFQLGGGAPLFRGLMKWKNLSFKTLSQIYQFKEEEKGTLTGNFDFTGISGDIRKLNGRGFCALQKGNIVSLPVFGPLSPIMARVLGDKRAGYERAKDASASFIVRNGVWQTDDFLALSSSLNLTGDGWIDLKTEKIDMTMRLNAQGLLGIITLPLSPFKGLFQFRGTGIFTQPDWQAAPFTQPRRGAKDPLFRKPGKAIIIPEF